MYISLVQTASASRSRACFRSNNFIINFFFFFFEFPVLETQNFDLLNEAGQLTVFAPTDEAFAKMDAEDRRRLMKGHGCAASMKLSSSPSSPSIQSLTICLIIRD